MSANKSTTPSEPNSPPKPGLWVLSLGALGVVYGDIGTSPLYAIRECFHGLHAIALNQTNIFGVLSLIFWSLMVVVTIKYVSFIMRADNRGEGGIFALLALLRKIKDQMSAGSYQTAVLAAVFGAALLYGDGIITPAISVLSAVEGLEIATKASKPFIIPLTVIILFLLFFSQKRGTAAIGKFFGPVMIIWFVSIAALGLSAILNNPEVLWAINPWYAFQFFASNHIHGIVVLGSVVLVITGGEALYADMGHFGPKAIRLSWLAVACPALLLNYFGQGALLMTKAAVASNPFYGLIPKVLIYPSVILSTVATIIASQAMISGVYSLTQQAIQLGYLPRVRIVHTSASQQGQIYLPEVNWAMMVGCIGLVLAFRESSRLAGAYGIAVTATMGITSIIYYLVVTRLWKWPIWKAGFLVGVFLCFDVSYLGANLLKILDGGWFTIGVAILITLSMTTWRKGRKILAEVFALRLSMDLFIKDIEQKKPYRIPGTAVFMSVNPQGVPVALMHHYKHHRVLFEQVILLSIITLDIPRIENKDRLKLEDLGQGFYRIIAQYGFMETPWIPEIMSLAGRLGVKTKMAETTFFLGRETLITSGKSQMSQWRKILFSMMSRNAMNPTSFFGIPPERVIEIGAQVRL
ncbi:MAG: potassium transporter Kup [Deltaproteobacteria bacterium]|nr:potassium transporter Kup [Deltaproteobacteria bacterium]